MDTPRSSLRSFAAIAAGYWTAPGHKSIAWTLTAGMLVFGVINVGITLWLNIWNRDFFNALEKRDTAMLVQQIYILAAIVVSGGVSVALHLHIRRRLQINWRSWLTPGKAGPFNFDSPATGQMVPDDPGISNPDRVWRRLASAVSAGISYRERGLKSSLHIAIRQDGANVHVDREGFVTSTNGRITYDLKRVINHISTDLASDYAPVLVSSLTVKDDDGRTTFQGNLAPWLEVNLPGTTDIGGARRDATEGIIGVRLFGIFQAGGG